MIRRLRQGILLAAVALVLWLLGQGPARMWLLEFQRRMLPGQAGAQREIGSISLAYELEEDRWLTFPLIGYEPLIRVLTNAELRAQPAVDDPQRWKYALEYQVLDEQAMVLRHGTYHLMTGLSLYRDAGGQVFSANRLLDGPEIPADGRVLVINTRQSSPRSLRLRLVSLDPALSGVTARVYLPEYVPSHKLPYVWPELSRARRSRLAEGNALDVDYLTEQEKRALSLVDWRPAGPKGLADRDFVLRRLVGDAALEQAEALEDEPVELQPLPVADAGHRIVLPLPEEGLDLQLRLRPAAGQGATEVLLRWKGPGAGRSFTRRLMLDGREQTLELPLRGGRLEIAASAAVEVAAFERRDGALEPYAPEQPRLRAYRCAPHASLDYEINHLPGHAGALRVDLRSAASGMPGAVLSFTLLDARGRSLGQGSWGASFAPSLYDRVAGTPAAAVSEPVQKYLLLPAGVSRIRFEADGELWLSLFNQLPGPAAPTRVPEDALASAAGQGVSLPGWFPLLPLGWAERYKDPGLSALLELQYRLSEEDADIAAGRYDWELVEPEGQVPVRVLLTAREPGLPSRPEAAPSLYRELPPGTELVLSLLGYTSAERVSSSLVYLRPEASPAEVELEVNGSTLVRRTLVGKVGRLELPPLPAGEHRVRLSGQVRGRFFLSHAQGSGSGHVSRLAHRLPRQGLRMRVSKKTAGEETLSFRLFSPQGGRVGLSLRLEGVRRTAGPFVELSRTERRYDVRLDGGGALVLDDGRSFSGGGPLFFRLGADLPPGDYLLRAEAPAAGELYLQSYRVMPGMQSSRSLRTEPWP